jgi:DNA-binding XRE family transcriptional regulator
MKPPVRVSDIIAKLPAARRARVEAEGERLLAEAMTLRELRKAHKLTQTKLARKLRTSQNQISRIEKHSDLLLSTLRGYVEGMGGKIDIVAQFPNRPPVMIAGLLELNPAQDPVKQR